MVKSLFVAGAVGFAALIMGQTASAQGLVGGAQQGYRNGNRVAGPVGGIVGAPVGAAVGTVNGALGIRPYHSRGRHHARRQRRHR